MPADPPPDFSAYVTGNTARLRRLAFELCRDQYEAEDIVAEVFLRAWGRWAQLSTVRNVHAYVRRMVVNEFITRYRRRRRLVVTDALEDLLAPAPDHTAEWNDQAAFTSRIAALPPRQRASVYLRYVADSSDAQIAAVLGCSVVTVRSNISRAMRTLRVMQPT